MSSPVIAVRPRALDTPRVGLISFLNCRPLLWGLSRTRSLPNVTQLSAEAAGERLVAGDLDLGPISLADYLRHTDELLLLPGLAIAAEGAVMSCNIVSHGRIEELRSPRVGLSSTSRTTVLLARILLEDVFGLSPAYFSGPPDTAELLRAADAAVVIGDPALRTFFDSRAGTRPYAGEPGDDRARADGPLHVHDTASLWTEWTGLPMVFAVWAVRREYARQRPEAVVAAHRSLLNARDLGLGSIDAVSAEAARGSDLSAAQLSVYYRTLRYDLDSRGLRGIERFAALAAARSAVPARGGLEMFGAEAGR
ncbi:menaquinone biosynthesis protein [Streptomyces sp. NPDC046939]|uniref:menaquinone biosynthetic enzyme MqnA/MqnD family protein n=1 Tax=Streptomyces sp. NPDC046939 TaxID=3155376 RepID=UPI0033DE938D